MGGATGSSSGGEGRRNAWEAVSIVLRIATVGMSLASAVTTFASTQCVSRDDGSAASTVSYSDYGSFKYAAIANLMSALLQAVAIWLEVLDKDSKWAKTVHLIDKVVLALTSTSAPLLLAADDITSCGGPPRGGRGRNNNNNNGARRPPKLFDGGKLQQLVTSFSLAPLIPAAANEVVKKVKQHEEEVIRSAQEDNNTRLLVLVPPSAAVPPATEAPAPPPPSPPPVPPQQPVLVPIQWQGRLMPPESPGRCNIQ
nr:unnamed protein product [Digitaria exilis]